MAHVRYENWTRQYLLPESSIKNKNTKNANLDKKIDKIFSMKLNSGVVENLVL